MTPDDIERAYQQGCYGLGWRFLMTPERTIRAASTALVTMNPGGRVEHSPRSWSFEAGSAYELESWTKDGVHCFQPGKEPLQVQVCRMFAALDLEPADVLSGYFVPFRSPGWSDLPNPRMALDFGRKLWTWVLKEASQLSLIIALGKPTSEELIRVGQFRFGGTFPVNWGTYTGSWFTNEAGQRLVVIPHLSQFRLFGRGTDFEARFREACGIGSA